LNATSDTTFDDIERHIKADNIELVRFAFCDQHGLFRGKTLVAKYAIEAMRNGLPMVGTLLLKDTSSRTAFPTFDPAAFGKLVDANPSLALFANASDVVMRADPTTFHVLPWAPNTAWIQCQAYDHAGNLLPFDARGQLQRALRALSKHGYGMRCGLEVEFHIYKLDDTNLAPENSSWPAPSLRVSMIHPGNNVLCEQWADMSDEPLRIVLQTAQALDLPIRSLEVELGPSQVECVFDVQDALAAADSMALFRSATKQALRRAGYHATFMCRPHFPNIVSSGWHLHQSLYESKTGSNVFSTETYPSRGRGRNATGGDGVPIQASNVLSPVGTHWLAGLLAHAHASCAFAVPTINGYARYQPNMMAPQRAIWGVGSRGAALRVVSNGEPSDAATRIENRLGEPAANPYLYIASQIHAGLDGIARELVPPVAERAPYGSELNDALPTSLATAIDALATNEAFRDGFGKDFVSYFAHIKRHEIARFDTCQNDAEQGRDWQQREYFSLF
jgi:glutamine synthetase